MAELAEYLQEWRRYRPRATAQEFHGTLGEASAAVKHSGTVALPRRQGGPHAHSANIAPDNRFVFFTDLGLDQVVSYKLDTTKGTLTPNTPPFAKAPPGLRSLARRSFSEGGKRVIQVFQGPKLEPGGHGVLDTRMRGV